MPTGHRFATPNVACAHISGNSYFCEEFNQIKLCVSSAPGLNSNYGRWTIIGRNSAYFTSVLGMQGNQQFGGMCLDIFQIPDMPYYPQTMTIQYWHPDIGEVISKKVVIHDCDNDDLTCHEYYNTSGSIVTGDEEPNVPAYYEIFHTEALQKMHNTGLKLKVYDMMGNVIVTSENSPISGYNIPQVLIYTFWDDTGRLVETRKVFAR